jgi:hypothetical protein
MIAMTLGAVLLTTVASMAGSMSRTIAQLQAESTDSYDKAMARMARDVRYAWWVDVPTRTQLRIADSSNRVTEYYRVGNSLLVRLPSGEEGAVVTGLDGVNFRTDKTQRLREAPLQSVSGRLDEASEPATMSAGLELVPGNQLAIAFMVGSNAGLGAVNGVYEDVVGYLPNRLDLKVAKVTALGTLHIDIHAARAPGDARPIPGAAALTGFDMSFLSLPLASVIVVPSNPLDPSTGVYASPAGQLPLAIPAFTPQLSPGVAYCAVITVKAGSMAIVGGNVSASPNAAVRFRATSSGTWMAMSGVVPFSLHGDSTTTSTLAQDVVRSVEISLDPSSGPVRASNVVVHSQVMAEDPWLGVIPGETAP